MTDDVALFCNASTILLLPEINVNGIEALLESQAKQGFSVVVS